MHNILASENAAYMSYHMATNVTLKPAEYDLINLVRIFF